MISSALQYAAASLSVGLFALWAIGGRMQRARPWIGLGAAALALVPLVSGLCIAELLLSANPSFSIIFMALMLSSFVSRATSGRVILIGERERASLAAMVIGLSLIVMPASLGLWPVDVYSMGYANRPMVIVIGLYALYMMLDRPAVGVVLGAAAGAYALDLMPSGNIFDSLIDAGGLFYCAAIIVAKALAAEDGADEAA